MFSETKKTVQPVILGEVLFDQFEDSQKTLGGAPFNVACHLQGFGVNPWFVSRIGSDTLGENVLHAMRDWGMNTSGVQRDSVLPTGVVHVALKNGHPAFEIPANQAWDALAVPDQLPESQPTLLYHGTLALRSDKNCAAVETIKKALNPFVFADLNLRAPWWDMTRIRDVVCHASAIKLSIEELQETLQTASNIPREDLFQKAHTLFDANQLQFIVVTMGGEGSVLLEPRGRITYFKAEPVKKIIDTVGAGDAFSSVVILGVINEWNLHDTMKRAAEFAARICSIRGAVSFDEAFYHGLLERWNR